MKFTVLIGFLAVFALAEVDIALGQQGSYFQSAIDTLIPPHPDLAPIKVRAEKEYVIVDYDPDRLVIQSLSTGNYAYIYSNGRLILASERKMLSLMDKDSLTNETGRIIDMIDEVSDRIDASSKWNATYFHPVFYAQEANIYKGVIIWGDPDARMSWTERFLLRIPDMELASVRFTAVNTSIIIKGKTFETKPRSWRDLDTVISIDITGLVGPGDYEFDRVDAGLGYGVKIIWFEAITKPDPSHITVLGELYRLADNTFQCRHINELFPQNGVEPIPFPTLARTSLDDVDINMPFNSAVYTYLPNSIELKALADELSLDYTRGNYSLVRNEGDYLTCHFYPGTGDMCYIDNQGRVAVLSKDPITNLVDIHLLMAELRQILNDIKDVGTKTGRLVTDETVSKALYRSTQYYNSGSSGTSYKRVSIVPGNLLEHKYYTWTLRAPDGLLEARMILRDGMYADDEIDGFKVYPHGPLWANVLSMLSYGDHIWYLHGDSNGRRFAILDAIATSHSENFSLSGAGSEEALITQSISIERLFGMIPNLAPPSRTKGDVNNDGRIRSNDAILTLRIAAVLITPSDEQFWAADMNGDGKVRSNDAILILRKAAGLAAPAFETIASAGGAINVALDMENVLAGQGLAVSITASNSDNLIAGDICVSYGSSMLKVLEVLSSSDVMIASNTNMPGLVRISFAGMDGLSNNIVATIIFDVLSSDVTYPALQSVELYDRDALPIHTVVVDGHSPVLVPEYTTAFQNFPNPLNPDTWIPYQLKEDTVVVIKIYAATGQVVRTLNLGRKSIGSYTDKAKAAYWDGRNESGEKVSSGVYFYTIQAGEFTATKKMSIAD